MKRTTLIVATLIALVGAGWLARRLIDSGEPPTPRVAFDGTRSRMVGATYTETDDATGRVLRIRGDEMVARDGKVGIVFRTPLRSTVALTGIDADLRGPDGAVILEAQAQIGTFDAGRKGLVLQDPKVTVGGLRVKTRRLLLRPDGALAIQGDYEIYREEVLLGRGRDFAGMADELAEKARGGGGAAP